MVFSKYFPCSKLSQAQLNRWRWEWKENLTNYKEINFFPFYTARHSTHGHSVSCEMFRLKIDEIMTYVIKKTFEF
jgi:hypothetical protein